MKSLQRKTIRYRSVLLLIVFISILTLFGCSSEKKENKQNAVKPSNNLPKETREGGFDIIPLEIPEGEFDRAIGWLDNKTIVYISNIQQGSNVYKYHLPTGRSTLLYKSKSPIVAVYISSSRERILIHSSRSSYEGMITILTDKGEELASENIESYELAFEWNPYNENILFVSSFTEEWDFHTYILDIKDNELSEIQLAEPFASWLTEDELIYLDWNEDQPSLLAPLKKVRYQRGEIDTILTDLFLAKAFKEYIMTIGLSQDSDDKGVYAFYSNNLKLKSSATVPLLSRYSDWLVPYFDLSPELKRFYTFRPLSGGEADTYSGTFQFVSIDIETGKETIILENGENEPVSCSADGKLCLYGNHLEKIIDVRKKIVFSLLKNGG
ncbi:hypothetical protein C0966_09495 [Bacillus methanolicus]|uniref:YqgU-like beta propeller domain-containing protein n=1 Tax=Bacillus methanolicus TaxID=1471 RepID=UPI00237FF53A|nr:hypothetical protein [Bacillus methanolicus]MDE3839589.1 hypothetical protein [Bacillus methanolicus]